MYEINYTLFFISSILLGKVRKLENSVMELIPKSIRDIVVSTLSEIVEAGSEHFSQDLVRLVNNLVSDDKGVFYILDNYQEMKNIHGDIVDEVITQASRFCCQYYRSNQAVLDELIGENQVEAVKACSVNEHSSIQDHINFIRIFATAGLCLVVSADAATITKLGESLMNTKDNNQQNQEKETDNITNAGAGATAPNGDEQVIETNQAQQKDSQEDTVIDGEATVESVEEAPTLMLGTVNLLDPGGILSAARARAKLQAEREEEEARVRTEAAEKLKKERGPWYKLGRDKATKEAREKTAKEVEEAMSHLHSKWKAEDEARAAAK